MKKRNKGFTLIELLAVIVVLAVIALIATPIVLKLVNNAREGAAESSATAYIKAVENGIMAKLIKEPDTSFKGIFTVSQDKTKIVSESGTEIDVDVKGNLPAKGGVVTIDENGTVTSATFNISNYEVECDADKCKVKGKKEQEEEEITYPSILEKATNLVYDENGACKTDGSTYNYMGGCYIKGANTSNYVWYNGFIWRIMGINSDNTVRLITDENVTALAYGPVNVASSYIENEGYIHDWLNEYFYNHLNSTKSIIQEGAYFCSESTNEVALTEGRTSCSNDSKITTKVGIISADEYLLAGGESSYLISEQIYWTMTPYNDFNVWTLLNTYGNLNEYTVAHAHGIRPVINVNSSSNVTSGDGNAQSFYVLEEDKEKNTTGKLSEKVTSGEYVSLEGHTYRVVSKTSDGVKLMLDEFYEETQGNLYNTTYGNNNIFTIESGIGQKLNTDVLTWLGISNSGKIVETTYYQGDAIGYGTTYNNTLKQSNGIKAKVGLIQVGEILASQSSSMLTKNYTTSNSYTNITHYWVMNKSVDTSYAWIVGDGGYSHDFNIAYNSFSIRPVITVRNDIDITSGTGTWKNPYQI